MELLKKVYDFFEDNILQLLELVMLIVSYCLPYFFDVQGLFKEYLIEEKHPTPENAIYYLTIEKGNQFIAIVLLFAVLFCIRKYNYEKHIVVNKANCYHNYPFMWYLFCAKILNIKNCNLILVPIHMQFKLVSRNVFEQFPLIESDYPTEESENIKIERKRVTTNMREVNIILEDTYPISNTQIPSNKKNLPSIKISRNNGNDFGRYFNQDFINSIITEVRKLPQDITINIFATTNPKNTVNIVRRVFVTGDRGNINRLYVFQQNRDGARAFESKGRKIY